MRPIPTFIALIFSSIAIPATAGPASCPSHFVNGISPFAQNLSNREPLYPLCYEGHAVLFSGATRTAVWSAERLTAGGLEAARKVGRVDAFHEENELPASARSRLEDFRGSCFDRGHLVPSADAATAGAQYQTFSLANIVPQDPANNQALWERAESATRALARQRGELYVITGPLYLSQRSEILANRVAVPTHFFKAIYDPSNGQGAAYITANSPAPQYDIVPIAVLRQLSGFDPFPSMSPALKSRAMSLPPLKPGRFTPRETPARCARNPDGTLASGETDSPRTIHQQRNPALPGWLNRVLR